MKNISIALLFLVIFAPIGAFAQNLPESPNNIPLNAFSSLKIQAALVTSNQKVYAGDTLQETYTLTVPSNIGILPDTDYTDLSRSWAYKGYGIYKIDGSVVDQKLEEITTTLASNQQISIPVSFVLTQSGTYTVIPVLVKVEKTYDRNSQAWMQSQPIVLASNTIKIDVLSIGAPEAPKSTDILSSIQAFINNILGSLRALLGL